VRSDRRGRRDGKAHARGVRVSMEFCNRRSSANVRKERNMWRDDLRSSYWRTIHFDQMDFDTTVTISSTARLLFALPLQIRG